MVAKSSLHCFYENGQKNPCPYCRLAPYKVELLNLDPEIYMFHEMIDNKSIEVVKEYAKPSLARSKVRTTDQTNLGQGSTRGYRISKNTWLSYESHPAIANLLKNLQHLTGLNMLNSEDLQVCNYGIGGHYEPHFDFLVVSVF